VPERLLAADDLSSHQTGPATVVRRLASRVAELPGAVADTPLPPGLPLGLRVGSFHATEISLPPGATLALYTDGLVESRTRPFDVGVTALRSALDIALAGTATTLASACETVTQALREHGEDDITLVLARIRQR